MTEPPNPPDRPTVLVVDDDMDTLVYMRALLGRHYEVLVASNAVDVRSAFASRGDDIEIVLMDVSLRGSEDGISLTRWIRSQPRFREVAIIACTAHADSKDHQRAIEAGCDAYVAKPFLPKELLSIMSRLVSRDRQRPEQGSIG